MPTTEFPKRRPSRTAGRRSKILPVTSTRPGLAVDTSFARHRAPAPQQVFPYESTKQELSFVSLSDIRALKNQKSTNRARRRSKRVIEDLQPQPPQLQRSLSDGLVQQPVRDQAPPPAYSRFNAPDAAQAPALHQRIKGLRPGPLELSTDISPSDRAITIGISLDPDAVSNHSKTPSSPAVAQSYPRTKLQRRPSGKLQGQEVATPTIVITPAKEDFDFELPQTASPEEYSGDLKAHRPTSSIYSRYTNCMPTNGRTPPVPPLPLFARGKAQRVRDSTATVFEEEENTLKVSKSRRQNNLSVCTMFEEDQPAARNSHRLTSQSGLPTPRRSRGWWNLITSPFSASSRTNAFYWRSPPPLEESETRMLDDASDMGVGDSHAGIIFTNRTSHDLDLRSAPPVGPAQCGNDFEDGRPRQPKRSDTAPGALDPSGQDGIDIYKIPYVGAAADYYNPHKRFSSMIGPQGETGTDRGLDDWSPSQSVHREPRKSVRGVIVGAGDGDDSASSNVEDPFDDQAPASRALDDEKSPFSDAHASKDFQDFSGTHPAATADKKFFATPAEEEMRGVASPEAARPDMARGETLESRFSPLSPTPVIENARLGTFMGPREVDVASSRAPSPYASGLGAATMASRGVHEQDRPFSEKTPFRHQRNDSYGLGIETDGESEKSLFPPPKPLAQQPRLGTDRFGQLTLEQPPERDPNRPAWYRRFLCPLVGLALALVVLFIVLLVLFVSQPHSDMPVQAQWLNLTGFPAMPTGIATVIQAKSKQDVGGCVKPEGLWSCAVPDDAGIGGKDAPNFRFEIRFRNKTSDMHSTDLVARPTSLNKRHLGSPSEGGILVRRSQWSKSLYASLPAPPPKDDMDFLGNTTDSVSEPFEGEQTPFYISLLNASALESQQSSGRRLLRRERGDGVYPYPTSPSDNNHGNSTDSHNDDASDPDNDTKSKSNDASTKAATNIPRPFLDPNGQPAPAQLYPLVSAQPLRLFNRGEDSEHYGFYTYFDRSVYIRASNTSARGENSTSALGDDLTSNTPVSSSNAVCTFSQTRMRVQFWTRRSLVAGLNETTATKVAAVNSTANDMTFPGSFPYPVTVTLDRHGGKADKKGVYCYGLNEDGEVDTSTKSWIAEDRGFEGTIVNPAVVPGEDEKTSPTKRDEGNSGSGIDGGDGGCACSWQT